MRAAVLLLAAAAVAQAPTADWGTAKVVLEQHCSDCHEGAGSKSGVDLFALPRRGFGVDWLAAVAKVRERVRCGEMPPPGEAQPTVAERQQLLGWCEATLAAGVAALPWPPGRVTVRRLSRSQWENCVRDLFAVHSGKAAAFPADDLGYGFDNIGAALSFSTLHLEKYLAAAKDVAEQVFDAEDPAHPTVRRFAGDEMTDVGGHGQREADGVNLITNGEVSQFVVLPRDGDYRLLVSARGDQAGDEPARMAIRGDGHALANFEVPLREFQEFEVKVSLHGGEHRIAAAFLNDYYEPKNPDPQRRDRNLHVAWLQVIGPLDVPAVPPARQWLVDAAATPGEPQPRAEALARALLLAAWRRPPTATEVQRIAGLAVAALQAGEPWALALRPMLTAALASPHFLFRVEPLGEPGDAALSGPALASRLAFFLWCSAPDAALLQLGCDGRLGDDAALAAEVDRLLADPRSDALATDFAAQWFELRALAERTPDPGRFPGFDDELRLDLRRQTELLFLTVLREGRDVRELLDSGFLHVDARLAAFYGLPAPTEPGFARVTLPPELRQRGGLLGHAITSNPTRTSPVKRGKWILENLLGAAPPPPPPGNDSLAGEAAVDSTATLRQQLLQHRERKTCAVCHRRMDALGFALENFDAIGRFRERDGAGVIDSTGELPDGRVVHGLGDLQSLLAADPAFVRTALRKLFVYAVGRDVAPVDRLHLDARADALAASGKVTLRDLLLAVVTSPPFRRRS
jgi:mono/diheme cytochrome c family protein